MCRALGCKQRTNAVSRMPPQDRHVRLQEREKTDLGVRQWVCSGCGVVHDRDTNAALNILARHGHVPPVVGIPVL